MHTGPPAYAQAIGLISVPALIVNLIALTPHNVK